MGGPLILETRAQKADGQIRAVSPHDRSSRACRAGSLKHLCWVPAENKTHPAARPPAGTPRLERTGDRPDKDRRTLSLLRREAAAEQARHRDSDAPEPLVRGPGVLHTRQRRRLSPRTLRSPALRAREHRDPRKDRGGRGAWPTALRALSPGRAAQSALPATARGVGGSTSRARGHLPPKHGAWDSDRTTRSTSGRFTGGGGITRLRVEGQSACLHRSHHAATLWDRREAGSKPLVSSQRR